MRSSEPPGPDTVALPASRARAYDDIPVVLLVAVAAAALLYAALQIGRPLEAVESDSLHMANGTAPDWATADAIPGSAAARSGIEKVLGAVAAFEFNPPLYFLMLRGWTGVFGTSPGSVRALSLLPALLSLVAIYALGRMVHDRRTGFLAACALAVLPVYLQVAVTARPYALALLVAIGSSLVWWRCVTGGGRRLSLWAAYTVLVVLAGLLHYLLAAVVIAHAVFGFVVAERRREYLRALALTWLAAGLALSFWYLGGYFAEQLRGAQEMGEGVALSVPRAIGQLGYQLLAGQGARSAARALTALAAAAIWVAAGLRLMEIVRADGRGRMAGLYAALLTVAPLAGVACIALASGNAHVLTATRYSLLGLPGVALLLGGSLGRTDVTAWFAAASLAALSVSFLLA